MTNESKYRQPSSSFGNNWNFNENNFEKYNDFRKKNNVRRSEASDFEVRMKASTIFVPPNDRPKPVESRDHKIDNPFLRKSLLVNKE